MGRDFAIPCLLADLGERMNYPRVSIIVLNWNGLEDTVECLGSLKVNDESKRSNYEQQREL